jgi:hypothetical protein
MGVYFGTLALPQGNSTYFLYAKIPVKSGLSSKRQEFVMFAWSNQRFIVVFLTIFLV